MYAVLMVATAVLASPVQAQDFPALRIDAHTGYDRVDGNLTYSDSAAPEDDFSEGEATSGAVFGATAGFDVPVGRVYLGVEASAEFAENERCAEVFGNDAACFGVGRNFAVGPRIGIAASKRTLVYVGGAWVNGQAKISYEDELSPENDFSFSDTQNGYRLSGGIEHRLQGSFFLKVEYRYSSYDDYVYELDTARAELGFSRHQVVAAIGSRF
jgi:outer membrane immunogenic protein